MQVSIESFSQEAQKKIEEKLYDLCDEEGLDTDVVEARIDQILSEAFQNAKKNAIFFGHEHVTENEVFLEAHDIVYDLNFSKLIDSGKIQDEIERLEEEDRAKEKALEALSKDLDALDQSNRFEGPSPIEQ